MAPNKSEIILKDGAFWRRTVTEQSLGDINFHLNQVVEVKRVLFPAGTITDPSLTKLGINKARIYGLLSDKVFVVGAPLPFLPTKVHYALSEDGKVLNPHFSSLQNYDNMVTMQENWKHPDLVPWFFVKGMYQQAGLQYVPESCFLALRVNATASWRRPYFPNIFEDGRICMGNTWEAQVAIATTLAEVLEENLADFWASKMNDHLVNNNTHPLFRRVVTSDGSEWAPIAIGKTGDEHSAEFIHQFDLVPHGRT